MSDNVISQHLQDSFLYLCITTDEFLRIVRPSLLPSFFSSAVCSDCIQVIYTFYDEYKKAPKDHFHDEIMSRLLEVSDKKRPYYTDYLKRIQKMDPPDFKYVMTKVSAFCQCRRLEDAMIKSADMVKEGKFEDARGLLLGAFVSGISHESLGLDYTKDLSNLAKRGDKPSYLVSTGIDALDKLVGGFERSRFVCFMGGYKAMKSFSLLNLAKVSLMKGLKVLYVSHELTEEEVELRMDMMWGALVKSKDPKEVEITTYDPKSGRFGTIKEIRPSVYDADEVKKVRRSMDRRGGRFVIKKYPAHTCTMDEFFRYLDHVELFHDFVPDVIINDYADIMDIGDEGNEQRHAINKTYMKHKRMADERNALVATASQVQVEAVRKRRIAMSDFSEDKRKAGNVDMAVALSQTEKMEEANTLIATVVANRSGRMNVRCSVLYNMEIGQFCLASW